MRVVLSMMLAAFSAVVILGACISQPEFGIGSDLGTTDGPASMNAAARNYRDANTNDAAMPSVPDAAPPVPSSSSDDDDAGDSADPPPPPNNTKPESSCNGRAGAICCGAVACIGCAGEETGECKKCKKSCSPDQLCCKGNGPLRCVPLGASCS